jgi:hypothetical protein
MSAMDEDNIVNSLTIEGPDFERSWSNFLFNVPQALKLREKEKEQVMQVLLAGQRYSGTGWTTGRASKTLHELSGVAIVRAQIDGYRDCWLYAVALMAAVDLPAVELPPEVAEAAFSLVAYVEQPEEQGGAHHKEDEDTEEEDEWEFEWDEPSLPLPKVLAALWSRAGEPEHKISMKSLLEEFPKLAGLPTRPADNNLLPDHKKKYDQTYKVLAQHVLHLLRVWAYKWAKPELVNQNAELQLWQYAAELYQKLQTERRELSLPGASQRAASSSTEVLFTEADVKYARSQQSIKDLGKKGVEGHKLSVGGQTTALNGQSFLSSCLCPTGGKSWKGSGKPYGRGSPSYQQRYPAAAPYKGFGYGKGGLGKGGFKGRGRGKGVPSCQPSHGDSNGLSQGGKSAGHGGHIQRQGGTPVGRPSPIRSPQAQSLLVEKACPPVRFGSGHKGGGTRLSRTSFKPKEAEKVRGRNQTGFGNHGGVCKPGSCKSGGYGYYQVLSTLVCDLQKRRRKNKKKANKRLQGGKSVFEASKFQVGPLEGHFPSVGAQDVGHQNRSPKRLFSLEPGSRDKKKFIRMEIGPKVFQMEAACFGLSSLPYLWMQVMQVFLKKWRSQGLLVFIYLDDILLLARSKTLAQQQTSIMLEDLTGSGMLVNMKKSHLEPTQKVEHLGFLLNLQEGVLMVPEQKLKSVQKELGKFLVQKEMSCRKAAAILGQLRSFLTALPCLRAFSDLLVQFTNQHSQLGWDKKVIISLELKNQVREIGTLLKDWRGRSFSGLSPVRKIFSDSSTQGWGAVDLTSGAKLQEFWRSDLGLHINIKELKASISACQSLAKEGETVFLTVDNQVAYSYLKKEGGRLPPFNSLMRPFLKWCHEKRVKVIPNLVKSS